LDGDISLKIEIVATYLRISNEPTVVTNTTSSSPTLAVLEAVAEAERVDPLDLPPLYDAVDTDALESVFEPTPDGGVRIGRIEFPYHGYRIGIEWSADGTLAVEADHRTATGQGGRAVAETSLD
jgi:hypothetical protein